MLDAVVAVRLAAAERDSLAQRAVQAGKRLSQFARELLTAAPVPPPLAAASPASRTTSAPIAWLFWDTGQVGGALTLRSTTPVIESQTPSHVHLNGRIESGQRPGVRRP